MLDNTYFIFLFTVFIYSFTDRKNKTSNFHDNYCCIISVIIAVLWFPLLSLYFYIFLLFKCTASKFIKRTTILAWLWNISCSEKSAVTPWEASWNSFKSVAKSRKTLLRNTWEQLVLFKLRLAISNLLFYSAINMSWMNM